MRKDGKRVKNNVSGMYQVIPYIMKKRYDAQNMITLHLPQEPLKAYLAEKRAQGMQISYMAIIIAAYLRTAAEFPALNRFIVNKRIYARNKFTVSMVIMRPGVPDGTMTKLDLNYTDTIMDVNDKINRFIETNRESDASNKTDEIIKKLLKIPGLINAAIGVLKFMDKYGLMPKSVIEASPFHASFVISNLASIRTNHIYHHLYDFGTISELITIGINEQRLKVSQDGTPELETVIPLGVVLDERVCSGSYFAKCFKRMNSYFANPSLLEQPPTVINRD